jgi:hypothetical protein
LLVGGSDDRIAPASACVVGLRRPATLSGSRFSSARLTSVLRRPLLDNLPASARFVVQEMYPVETCFGSSRPDWMASRFSRRKARCAARLCILLIFDGAWRHCLHPHERYTPMF